MSTIRPATTLPKRVASNHIQKKVREGYQDTRDHYQASRVVAQTVSGAVIGGAVKGGEAVLQSPKLAKEIVENVWEAETIGPNLKVLGTLAALPGAALSIPAAALMGLGQGVEAGVLSERPLSDSSRELSRELLPGENGEPSFTEHVIDSLEDFGDRKLAPGEKPYDVPILSPAFSVAGGVGSGLVAGSVGLVAGTGAGAIVTAREIKAAWDDDQLGPGDKAGRMLAAPLSLLVMGPALAWNGLKESVPRGFSDGWDHGPVKPIWDTTLASLETAREVLKEAGEH